MPLTKVGKRIRRSFGKQYGARGKEVFYRTMNKRKKATAKWHRKPRKRA
jgi:hypothetical protein